MQTINTTDYEQSDEKKVTPEGSQNNQFIFTDRHNLSGSKEDNDHKHYINDETKKSSDAAVEPAPATEPEYESDREKQHYQKEDQRVDEEYGAPVALTSMEKPESLADGGIIHGLVYPGQMTLVIGQSKVGKSLLGLQMAVSAATGNDFLGHTCKKIGTVLYCNLEISPDGFTGREIDTVAGMGLTHMDVQNLLVWNLRGKDINTEKFIDDLIIKVKAIGVGLIVLDPLYILMADADENDNSAVTKHLKRLQKLLEESGAALVVIHHISDKNPAYGGNPNRLISGASAIARNYDTLLALQSLEIDEEIPVECADGSEVAARITFCSRNIDGLDPIDVWRKGTVFTTDTSGLLSMSLLRGESETKDSRKQRKDILDKMVDAWQREKRSRS